MCYNNIIDGDYYMCFITYGFIERARYEMGSLGFKPKNIDEMHLPVLKKIIADSLLRLKDTEDAFYINYHYRWVINHWKKIKKALCHEKWETLEVPYSRIDIKRNKNYYSNVYIITNIFSDKFNNIYYDNSIKIEDIQLVKTKENPFEVIQKNDRNYIFTKEYLKKIKKKHVDYNKAIAEFDIICVDYKKNKYVSYVLYYEDVINNTFTANVTKSNIEGLINSNITLQTTRMISLIMTMNMIRRNHQINRINQITRF